MVLLIGLSNISYAQQFSLTELLTISKSQRNFEIKMIGSGNDLIFNNSFDKKDTLYSYETKDGGYGVSKRIPTNDIRLQARYSLPDGTIITETELDSNNYTVEQRNELFDSGKLFFVAGPQDKFSYKPNLINYRIYFISESEFAENYDRVEKVGYTFYHHFQFKYLNNKGKGPVTYHNRLDVQLARNTDFKNLLKQIQLRCKYLETDGLELDMKFSFFDPIVKKRCKITASPDEDGTGGNIDFDWEEF